MQSDVFEFIFDEQVRMCKEILVVKAKEYATVDRLHNFKVTAALQGSSPRQALAGLMAKHTVSIYDMCKTDKVYPPEMWNEKITDHMNYLILLRAILYEEAQIRNGTYDAGKDQA